MKKKILLLSACLLLCAGCGNKKIELKDGEQVIVSLKDDKSISVKDLYDKMKSQYGLQAVIGMVDKMILEDKYQNDTESAKKDAESQINELKETYGDKLLQTIQYYTNYNSIEEYQNSVYISYLQQKAVDDYAKGKISESDIKKYYKNEIKSDIKVAHILITSSADSSASTDEKKELEKQAEETAKEVISKLKDSKNVSETFKELAKEYSKDEATKEDGGNLGFINVDTLGDNYKELVDAAYKLKDGEYTKEVVKTELGYHIVLRLETKEKAALDEVRDTIVDKLVDEYITKNADAQIKAMQELRKEYNMEFNDEDLHTYYANYIRNSLEQIKSGTN